jgi:hypothetical protein
MLLAASSARTKRIIHETQLLSHRNASMRRSIAGRSAAAVAALALGSLAVAQIAEGPNVNPRTMWADPPEMFTSRVPVVASTAVKR